MLRKRRWRGSVYFPGCQMYGYVHDRKAATDVLARPATDDASPTLRLGNQKIFQTSEAAERRKAYARAPQFPMIVATVALKLVNPLFCSR